MKKLPSPDIWLVKNSHLQNFQFKLLHRIIPNNSFLYKIKLKNTNLCTFCKIHNETIEHLFFDCPVKQSFLKLLSKQLIQYYKNLIFDKKRIFLCFESGDLSTKWYNWNIVESGIKDHNHIHVIWKLKFYNI